MVTRILWLVLLLGVVGAAQEKALATSVQSITFDAIVQDSGTFKGAKCDFKHETCAAYERKLCEFLREPLMPLGPPYKFCKMLSHENREKNNTMKVQLEITLFRDPPMNPLSFWVEFPTFGALLNQSLIYFHNTPEAGVTITKLLTSKPNQLKTVKYPTQEAVVVTVTGTLMENGETTSKTELTPEDTCEIGKQLFNLDMGSELVNVIYKYSPKTLYSPVEMDQNKKITLKLSYPKTFFDETNIDYIDGFTQKIKWALNHPTNTKNYYLGGAIEVTQAEEAALISTEPPPIPFEFTALVQDDGKLYGTNCGGPQEHCIEYKQRLCQLAKKPLTCDRVPTSWDSCTVDVLGEKPASEPLKAKIKLNIREKKNYPINYAPPDSCSTFAGMYKLDFASQSANPKLDITEFTPPLKPVAITTEEVDIQIRGTLKRNGADFESKDWNKNAEEKVKADLSKLPLPDKMLNTFYHFPSRKLKSLEIDTTSSNVIATLTITYPKTVFEENAIDPGCDLNNMLQWGIRSAEKPKGFSFSAGDTVVENSAAVERSTTFTFKATVTDNGKFQGAECSGKSEQCIKYKEKLCAFVKKAFTSSEIVSEGDCLIEILSNRDAEKNALDVSISLQLNMHASKLQFDVNCPTFGWVLNDAFDKLYNTPDAKLTITKIETLQTPPIPPPGLDDDTQNYVTYLVTGTLYQNGKPALDSTEPQNIDECEVDKQIATLDMGEDLLNVMYKYNKDKIFLRRTIKGTDGHQKPPKFSFLLHYKKDYFKTADSPKDINPNCDFADKLQWGFRHPVSKNQFYMGEDTKVERQKDADPNPGAADVKAIEYTATVTDDGKLNGIECDPKTESCAEYKSELCQLIESPLLCMRVASQPGACTIKDPVRSEDGKSLTATVTLNVRESRSEGDLPTITNGCDTFKALHILAFKTFYDNPIVDLKFTPTASQGSTGITQDPVVFKITGKLHRNGILVKPEEFTDPEEVKYQLANLNLPGKLLQAFYKYNTKRSVEFTKPNDQTPYNGDVEFTVSYKKTDLEEIGLTSTCDLEAMLRWGFKNAKELNEYYLDEAKVNDS